MMSGNESFGREDMNEMVPVVFAGDQEEALMYRELLEDHDIPAGFPDEEYLENIDEDAHSEFTHGVAVLVPEVLLEEAGAIIAQRQESGSMLVDYDDMDNLDDDDDDYDSESMTDLDDLTDFSEDEDSELIEGLEELDDDEDEPEETDLEAFKAAFGEDLLGEGLLGDLEDEDLDGLEGLEDLDDLEFDDDFENF